MESRERIFWFKLYQNRSQPASDTGSFLLGLNIYTLECWFCLGVIVCVFFEIEKGNSYRQIVMLI